MTVTQVQKIIGNYLQNSGRGGFITGIVSSVSPLTIKSGDKLILKENNIYITDSCIGLKLNLKHTQGGEEKLQDDIILRPPLKKGDGVLMISRPDTVDGVKYIIIDRIQPYQELREVDGR